MRLNTTCSCNACKNMKLLDLKACVHYGEYLIQKLGDQEELLGADVIVPHTETYEHLGEVQIQVHNLRAAWENYLDEMHYVVNPETAWIKIELDIPFPPPLIWDYITTPRWKRPSLAWNM